MADNHIDRLLGLSLVCNGSHLCGKSSLIAEIILIDYLEVVIELIDKWDSGRDVDSEDLFLGHVVEILHKGSE